MSNPTDTNERLDELRRRLYIAERAECRKLAEMWRRQIQELEREARHE